MYETDYTQMLDPFKELQRKRKDIKNVYFSGTVPYKDGGTLVIVFGDNLGDFDQTTREWYKESIKNSSSSYITSPYKDAETGDIVITISKAVMYNGAVKGVIGIDISFTEISQLLLSDNESKFFIALDDGRFITHNDDNLLFNEQRTIYTEFNAPQLDGKNYAIKVGKEQWTAVYRISDTPWLIVGNGSSKSLSSRIFTLSIIMVIVALGFLGIQYLLVMFNVNPLSQTLDRAIEVITNMSNKHFNANFDEKLLKKSDQTGVLVNSIKDMQKSLGSSIHFIQESLNFINNEIDAVSEDTGKF